MKEMKGKFIITLFIALLIVFGISTSSEATLINRDGGLIYDTDLDMTLMQEINSSWLLSQPGMGTYPTGVWGDGIMSWPDAKRWEEGGIVFNSPKWGPITGWRMLSITDRVELDGDGIKICTGYDCNLSEFGHIWYTELGNTAGTLTNMEPLFTLTGSIGAIWGSESWGDWPDDPFPYPFAHFIWSGSGGYQGWGDCHIVWLAVDGDVVPEPATLILLGAGVLGLAGRNRLVSRLRRKRS